MLCAIIPLYGFFKPGLANRFESLCPISLWSSKKFFHKPNFEEQNKGTEPSIIIINYFIIIIIITVYYNCIVWLLHSIITIFLIKAS